MCRVSRVLLATPKTAFAAQSFIVKSIITFTLARLGNLASGDGVGFVVH